MAINITPPKIVALSESFSPAFLPSLRPPRQMIKVSIAIINDEMKAISPL